MAAKSIGGHMGKILGVGLGSEQINEESLDNETLRKDVGVSGLEGLNVL